MVTIVAVKDLPSGHKGILFVICSKGQPDFLFNTRRKLSVMSETGEECCCFRMWTNWRACFWTHFTVTSSFSCSEARKIIGTISISLLDLVNPISAVSTEKWFWICGFETYQSMHCMCYAWFQDILKIGHVWWMRLVMRSSISAWGKQNSKHTKRIPRWEYTDLRVEKSA